MAEDGTLGPEQVPVGDVTKEFDAKSAARSRNPRSPPRSICGP